MKKFKYMAAMSLFEHFHAKKKNTDEIIACFISNYIKSEKKYSFVLIEIANDLNSYYNFNLPIAVVELGVSKVPFVSWDRELKTYYVDSDIWTDSYDSIDFVKQEEKNKELFNSLVEYVERKKRISLSSNEKDELLDSLCVFLLEYKTNSPFLDYISSFVLEHEDDSIKSQLESIADGMIVYMGISSDVEVSPSELFEDPITLYLDTEILFHFAGYNGAYYKQQFDEFFNLIRDVNKTNKIITLAYFKKTRQEINDFFNYAKRVVEGEDRCFGKVAMNNIIKGCSKERDVIAKQKLFFEKLKEMDVYCDREDYYENSENNQYCLGDNSDSDIDVLTFINILRKGRNNRPFLEIRYLLISGTSLYIEYNPEPGNAKFHSFAISISHITKILWFKLNKGFGIQKRMISFDVVCRAKMALSAITSIEIRKRYDDISERFKNQLITEDTAAACILDYKRNLKAPEDYNQLNVDSTMDFLSDDSIDRVQNESAMKDAKIVELNSQNETVNAKLNETVEKFNQITEESVRKDAKIEELSLQKNATEEKLGSVERQNSLLLEQLNVYKNMELIKKRNSARIKGVVVFLIDVLLLLVTVGLFIFDVVEIVVPFLDSVSSGKGIVISLIGGVLLSGLSLKKIIQLLKKCLLSPLKNKWFSTKL